MSSSAAWPSCGAQASLAAAALRQGKEVYNMTAHTYTTPKEARVSKKYLFVALLAFVIVALAAAPAFAEGYNVPTQYTSATGWFSGPHGGYTTSTNKCADCHATHYAAGSFMLMRANSREAACDYCHGGGGGSSINIMMDNEYKAYSDEFWLDGSVVATTGAGFGTGHTLGYTGKAPADIKPAYENAEGLACFDCHSPHGNSARIIGVIGDPGRAVGWDNQVIPNTLPPYIGNSDGTLNSAGEWGIDPVFGNFKWFGDPWATGGRPADDTVGGRVIYRPIFPAGRFLLVKDPHSTADELQADTVTPFNLPQSTTATVATNGVNKYEIDWDEPMGPADGGYGGFQDNDNDKGFLFAPKQTVDTDGNGELDGGFASVSEFCVDCHDGTAGASTQPAEVWQPSGVSGSTEGTYAVTFSHDAQPRH